MLAYDATASTPACQMVQPWAESAYCWLAGGLQRHSSPCHDLLRISCDIG